MVVSHVSATGRLRGAQKSSTPIRMTPSMSSMWSRLPRYYIPLTLFKKITNSFMFLPPDKELLQDIIDIRIFDFSQHSSNVYALCCWSFFFICFWSFILFVDYWIPSGLSSHGLLTQFLVHESINTVLRLLIHPSIPLFTLYCGCGSLSLDWVRRYLQQT
jgi:hypothetical protein